MLIYHCKIREGSHQCFVPTSACSASVRRISVEADPSFKNCPRESCSRHMSLMALAVLPVSFREWTNTRTFCRKRQKMKLNNTDACINWYYLILSHIFDDSAIPPISADSATASHVQHPIPISVADANIFCSQYLIYLSMPTSTPPLHLFGNISTASHPIWQYQQHLSPYVKTICPTSANSPPTVNNSITTSSPFWCQFLILTPAHISGIYAIINST